MKISEKTNPKTSISESDDSLTKEVRNKLLNDKNPKNATEESQQKDTALNKDAKQDPKSGKLEPTHFGDWQVNCRAIDF